MSQDLRDEIVRQAAGMNTKIKDTELMMQILEAERERLDRGQAVTAKKYELEQNNRLQTGGDTLFKLPVTAPSVYNTTVGDGSLADISAIGVAGRGMTGLSRDRLDYATHYGYSPN